MRTWIGLIATGMAVVAAAPAFAGTIQAFDEVQFRALQAKNNSVVIFVHAPWCPVCRAQQQTIERLIAQAPYRNLTVFRIDFDTQKPLWRPFGVTSQSTLVAFHGTRETGRLSYDTDAAKITSLLATSLK